MKIPDNPISAMLEGARTTTGSVLTFAFGVIVGTTSSVFITFNYFGEWYWYPFVSIFLVPYTMCKLWGILLIPLYSIIFYGIVWLEWNRVLCFSIISMATSIILLITFGKNPFSEFETMWRFLIVEGIQGIVLLGSIILEITRKISTPAGILEK